MLPQKLPETLVSLEGNTNVRCTACLSPLSPPDTTGGSITLLCLEGVPDLPGALQDEAGLTRKFETSHVGGATCRTTPISRSALDKNPKPGHLFEGNPVGQGTTRRGTDTTVHHPEKP